MARNPYSTITLTLTCIVVVFISTLPLVQAGESTSCYEASMQDQRPSIEETLEDLRGKDPEAYKTLRLFISEIAVLKIIEDLSKPFNRIIEELKQKLSLEQDRLSRIEQHTLSKLATFLLSIESESTEGEIKPDDNPLNPFFSQMDITLPSIQHLIQSSIQKSMGDIHQNPEQFDFYIIHTFLKVMDHCPEIFDASRITLFETHMKPSIQHHTNQSNMLIIDLPRVPVSNDTTDAPVSDDSDMLEKPSPMPQPKPQNFIFTTPPAARNCQTQERTACPYWNLHVSLSRSEIITPPPAPHIPAPQTPRVPGSHTTVLTPQQSFTQLCQVIVDSSAKKWPTHTNNEESPSVSPIHLFTSDQGGSTHTPFSPFSPGGSTHTPLQTPLPRLTFVDDDHSHGLIAIPKSSYKSEDSSMNESIRPQSYKNVSKIIAIAALLSSTAAISSSIYLARMYKSHQDINHLPRWKRILINASRKLGIGKLKQTPIKQIK